jgi:hypothetical protein
MKGVRRVQGGGQPPQLPCQRCRATGCPWDQIAGQSICPDCQELLVLGEGEPLIERLVSHRCAICRATGTVPYVTWPLHKREALAIDLCPAHFRALLGRRLHHIGFRALARQLQGVGTTVQQIFLLHEAFYDEDGRPLQPVP